MRERVEGRAEEEADVVELVNDDDDELVDDDNREGGHSSR